MKKWHEIHIELVSALREKVKEYGVDKVGDHLLKLFLEKRENYEKEFNWLNKSYNIVLQKQKTGEWLTEPQIDPLQIFVSINNRASKKENRIKRIKAIFNILNINVDFEEIDFEGCPTPVVVQAIQLKTDKDAILLWQYFQKVSNNKYINKNDFKMALQVYGVEATLLSIFTFWISPAKYIPLDKWTISYLANNVKSLNTEDSLSRTEKLFEILNLTGNVQAYTGEHENIISLVLKAYEWQGKEEGLVKGNFKLLAFRTLQLNKKLFKILEPEKYYILDHNLRVERDGLKYKYDKFSVFDSSIFERSSSNDLNININAIVGKNGSGKSTLIELFYMLMYNLSLQQKFISYDRHGQKLYPIEDINFEIYFEYIDVFKLTYNSHRDIPLVALFKGEVQNDDGIILFRESAEDLGLYGSLFYTLGVNYSLYSLNSLDYIGIHNKKFDWLSSLTHKNDGYQTPIVITPLRTNGNIDVNLEKRLTRQRVLINLLTLHNSDEDSSSIYSFRALDKEKAFTHVEIVGETEKIKQYRINLKLKDIDRRSILDGFLDQFENEVEGDYKKKIFKNYIENLSPLMVQDPFNSIRLHYNIISDVDHAYQLYLILKLYKICWYYSDYYKFYNSFKNIIKSRKVNFDKLLHAIDEDNSHITDKFKQVINFLKSNALKVMYQPGNKYLLDEVNESIQLILTQGIEGLDYPKKLLKKGFEVDYKHLIIPPIYNYEYYIKENGKEEFKADNLSSGEQQQLNSFGNILYHIKNLESKHGGKGGGVQYRFVNVVLDEVELYFHPEYQRTYIFKLVNYLTSASFGLNNIWGVNLLFSTHSPFILSDIPSQKVLRIKEGLPSYDKDGLNSFAANIHDLLKDEFFLAGGSIGEFAKKYVYNLITELTPKKDENDRLLELKISRHNKQSFIDKIDIVGEPLLKNSLLALLNEIELKDDESEEIPSYDELVVFYKNHKT